MGSAHYDGAMARRQTFRSTQQASGPDDGATLRIQVVVFALVGAAFTSVYVPQPVLPILQAEFHTTPGGAALSISAVIAGILTGLVTVFTQLQDPAVALVPRVLAVAAAIALFAGPIAHQLVAFANRMWPLIATVGT